MDEFMTYQEISKYLTSAAQHLAAEDYSAASVASHEIIEIIESISATKIVTPDSCHRPFSIVIASHRRCNGQKALRDLLLSLDNEKYELIFVENSDLAIFDVDENLAGRNVTLLRLGFNAGIGVARNIAIRIAAGEGIIFIDDDGITTSSSIDRLVSTFENYSAVAVRGRVVSRTKEAVPPPAHYNVGDKIQQRYCDIEGFSIWRKKALQRVKGFDPILYGHEGIELTTRLYELEGPDAFLYEPKAILNHDFAVDSSGVEAKIKRYKKLSAYCNHKNPSYNSVLRLFQSQIVRNPVATSSLEMRRRFCGAPKILGKTLEPITIISTCYNAAEFVPDFAASIAAQTDNAIELIFVDDGSDDDSSAILDRSLPKFVSRRIINAGRVGRAAALNIAVNEAKTDLCIIADADDINTPHRIEWTRKAYSQFPDADMIGLMIFDYSSHTRASRPLPCGISNLQARKLLGMPAPFPGFSFRKSSTSQRFDESLDAGIDCDWLFRSLVKEKCRGYLLPLLSTFYRTHEGQITSSKRFRQREVALRHIAACHAELLGCEPTIHIALERLVGWSPIHTGNDYWSTYDYGMSLFAALRGFDAPWAGDASLELLRHLEMLHVSILKKDYENSKKSNTAIAQASSQKQQLVDASLLKLRHLQAENVLSAKRISDLQDELNRVHSSKSMKLTAPLRNAAARIRPKNKDSN